jgi:hypothetical protein
MEWIGVAIASPAAAERSNLCFQAVLRIVSSSPLLEMTIIDPVYIPLSDILGLKHHEFLNIQSQKVESKSSHLSIQNPSIMV